MERSRAWPVASETERIETASGQTFVRVSGDVTKPPLVLLPGSLATSLTWIPNIADLSAHYRTYALDSIYDFGLSVRKRKLKTPQDLTTWLDEVLAALVPRGPLNLMGLSYGGWLATAYSLRFPERVRKLVMLSPAATVLPVSPGLIFRAALTLLPFPAFRQRSYYWLLQDAVRSGEINRTFVDEAVADWAVAQRCFRPMPTVPVTVLSDAELHGFKVTALFLVGENEKMYSARKAVSRLNRVAPQIKTEIIPHVGHDLSFTQPDLINGKILDFLGADNI